VQYALQAVQLTSKVSCTYRQRPDSERTFFLLTTFSTLQTPSQFGDERLQIACKHLKPLQYALRAVQFAVRAEQYALRAVQFAVQAVQFTVRAAQFALKVSCTYRQRQDPKRTFFLLTTFSTLQTPCQFGDERLQIASKHLEPLPFALR